MTRALASRVAKLERRGVPPLRIHASVVTIDARTGAIIGPKPKGKVMVAPHFGTDDEWSEQLQAQQSRLISSAGINDETQTERHSQ